MPEIARKIAKVLSQIVSVGISAVKVLKAIFGSIYDFIESLPANVRKWAGYIRDGRRYYYERSLRTFHCCYRRCASPDAGLHVLCRREKIFTYVGSDVEKAAGLLK